MVAVSTLFSFLTVAGAAVMAAPTNSVTITVKNSCKKSIQVNQLTNDERYGKATALASGKDLKIAVPSNWGGRIWAREGCSGSSDCHVGAPASLAEFLLTGSGGMDFYDVSFVDGFNMPVSISPNGQKVNPSYEYQCGSPTCSVLPSCPKELQATDDQGNYVGCKSACHAFGTPEYCCTGEAESRAICQATKFSLPVKNACPNVYTYAYDDNTSMYACAAPQGYTVTFCPTD
ncbi:thaumatin [Sporodiniella umbellata]|nr:thaumatin [Sporodiniella umbellata]